uniref:RING-type domain-containing protein n=1 Tax=Cyprinodon variegatus TaxID=28743 RepID=A0A3Q2EJF2_CYPVA
QLPCQKNTLFFRMSAVTEDLCCPICQDIFKDPVVISCSHSFCKTCLQKWWKEKKTLECPICKRKSSRSDPPRNLVLKNLCEAYERPNNHRLKIFCLDHQQPVCVICRDSKIHNQHHFRPLNEAAQEKREELQKFLKPLQEKLTRMEEAKGDGEKTVKFIKLQSQQTEKQIKEQFHKLYQFLQQEEKAKVAALRNVIVPYCNNLNQFHVVSLYPFIKKVIKSIKHIYRESVLCEILEREGLTYTQRLFQQREESCEGSRVTKNHQTAFLCNKHKKIYLQQNKWKKKNH